MITWIVLIGLTAMCAALLQPLAVALALICVALGLTLYAALSAFITPDYVVSAGPLKMIMALPPVMISALFFGMLDRWMNRMGFGSTFRLWVTAIAFTLFTGQFVPATAAPILIAGAFASALWRLRSTSPLVFLPSATALVASVTLSIV